MKERVLNYLKFNSTFQKPIVSKKLQYLYNISDLTVRQAVGLLRDDGYPIASGAKGFYFAKSADELEGTIDNLQERIAVMSRRRSLLIQAQNKMREDDSGQRLLFDNIN